MIYAGSRGEIVALDERTGLRRWQVTLSGGLFGHLKTADMSIVDHDGRVFVGANGYIICLSAGDGRELWRHDIDGARQDWVALSVAGRAATAEAARFRSDGGGGPADGGDGGGD